MDFLHHSKSQSAMIGNLSWDELNRQISVLHGVFVGIVGAEKAVLRAGRYEALPFIHSEDPRERLVGLQRLIFESKDFHELPKDEEVPTILHALEDVLADLLARQAVEERLERCLNEKIDEKNQDYMREVKLQLLNEELESAETPRTEEKLKHLEALEKTALSQSVLSLVKPKKLHEMVGQEEALEGMLAKLATPYPQHMILYGPPGVGKTTAARLALGAAKEFSYTPFKEEAPFVEVDGTTLRWDDRDITNPLIGSVHDPIYQGAHRDFSDTGIPEPKPGLVTEAHGGILFIDEIGEMDYPLLNKLLKVLEDKRVPFESSYYDETDPRVPAYVKKLFKEGAPADFILVGATTRDPSEISPAIRSRCSEIFFSPLGEEEIAQIVRQGALKLGVDLEEGVPELISQYTEEGRKAISLLADAFSVLLRTQAGETKGLITKAMVYKVARGSRLTLLGDTVCQKAPQVGHVNGLGVAGYQGSVIEMEALAFKASEEGKGKIHFNQTAGSMAQDSVCNASAVVRQVTGKDLSDYDLHINVIGGGNIDGPSAGCAIVVAIISALENIPVRQEVTVTGEISIRGEVKPVGGVFEKAYGAKRAKAKVMLIPKENEQALKADHLGLKVIPVQTIKDVLEFMLYTQ